MVDIRNRAADHTNRVLECCGGVHSCSLGCWRSSLVCMLSWVWPSWMPFFHICCTRIRWDSQTLPSRIPAAAGYVLQPCSCPDQEMLALEWFMPAEPEETSAASDRLSRRVCPSLTVCACKYLKRRSSACLSGLVWSANCSIYLRRPSPTLWQQHGRV